MNNTYSLYIIGLYPPRSLVLLFFSIRQIIHLALAERDIGTPDLML